MHPLSRLEKRQLLFGNKHIDSVQFTTDDTVHCIHESDIDLFPTIDHDHIKTIFQWASHHDCFSGAPMDLGSKKWFEDLIFYEIFPDEIAAFSQYKRFYLETFHEFQGIILIPLIVSPIESGYILTEIETWLYCGKIPEFQDKHWGELINLNNLNNLTNLKPSSFA